MFIVGRVEEIAHARLDYQSFWACSNEFIKPVSLPYQICFDYIELFGNLHRTNVTFLCCFSSLVHSTFIIQLLLFSLQNSSTVFSYLSHWKGVFPFWQNVDNARVFSWIQLINILLCESANQQQVRNFTKRTKFMSILPVRFKRELCYCTVVIQIPMQYDLSFFFFRPLVCSSLNYLHTAWPSILLNSELIWSFDSRWHKDRCMI